MNDYSWPADGRLLAERSRLAWSATVAALPVGAPIAGEVIGRQPFGVFIRIDGAPDAVGLAEVTTMPREGELPPMGARITGTVVSHAEHNHQVRVRLANRRP
ncbi:RNA-binding protein [Saccharothrix carnea]|uniref:RNA-binding protein n=1 Tax=Saccharothrix carnea TaxID=1280637 RepID=UPI0015E76A35|nr:RNA-binding protein [Saccharothrix carnea]